MSMFSAALVASLVGFGSTIALVLAAAQAVGATPAEAASWVAAVSIAKGLASGWLSLRHRMPIVLAWSTPGAALIAATQGIALPEAAGAFIAAGLMIAATGLIAPLGRMIAAIPAPIAAAMLAGVLLPFTMDVARFAVDDWAIVLPLAAVFVVVRTWSPLYAAIAALLTGLALGAHLAPTAFDTSRLAFDALPIVLVTPVFDPAIVIGLAVPLYLVTMASQNLPGFAVLRANGYEPPVSSALTVTGLGSAAIGFFGAHPFNMAAITAAICLGPDVHQDPQRRWRVGLWYAAIWVGLGLASTIVVPVILAMPRAIIAVVAGLALIGPLMGAAEAAFREPETRFAATVAFAVTASGMAVLGIGAAFWGLATGLLLRGVDRVTRRRGS
ncbi:MAG: benzoate/H(+) symporter BenE family transporter [Hyphomicrobiaceae bacterium]